MPIPAGAIAWAQPIDPSDRADFLVQFARLLTGGEVIQSASVSLLPEAVALGLKIIEGGAHGPSIANETNIEIWFEVEEALRENIAFRGGADLPVEITIHTNATPPRRFQRTMVVRVVHL